MLCCAGVPHLLKQKWAVVQRELMEHGARLQLFHNVVLRLDAADEAQLAPVLDKLAAEFGGQLALGSYPVRLCVVLAVAYIAIFFVAAFVNYC
jgi:hypothetical protein